jgi:hypothetical protein
MTTDAENASLFGDDLIDFIEKRGIQIWPTRQSKHGPVINWWVQNVSPWVQTSDTTLRGALAKLQKALQQ